MVPVRLGRWLVAPFIDSSVMRLAWEAHSRGT
jgi:hypothetical protein